MSTDDRAVLIAAGPRGQTTRDERRLLAEEAFPKTSAQMYWRTWILQDRSAWQISGVCAGRRLVPKSSAGRNKAITPEIAAGGRPGQAIVR